MSDIVERLHLMTSTHERHEFGVGDYWNVCEEAADEIERLRAENATLREALKNHAEEAAKMVSAEPVAYLHTMHCEFDQTNDRLTFDEQHPFGIAGENYSAEYPITTTPLYCLPQA